LQDVTPQQPHEPHSASRGIRELSRAEAAVRSSARRLSPYRDYREPVAPPLDDDEIAGEVEAVREPLTTGRAAKLAAIVALVALGIVVAALALWKIRLVVTLLFLALTIAAAMRPGVEALRRRRIPRSVGILLNYGAVLGLIALFLWLVVPRAIDQVQAALGENALGEAAAESTGVRHDILVAVNRQLHDLPSTGELVRPAAEYGRTAFEVFIGIFFVFASAAYWLYERDRAMDVVTSLVSRPKRKKVRDTWELIDSRLGAYVRGQLVLIVLVAIVLSAGFWAIGLPYWILVGTFAGIVEIVPVIGPIVAGALAIGVGLTASAHVAVLAGAVVLAVRLLEDYLVIPRVLGHSVGLSPLIVLVSVTSVGILFGGYAVILAIPIACLIVTLVDVIVRDKEPEEAEVPRIVFPAKDAEDA
jgi:predicted PurR-regulated permease PerM